MTVPQPQNAPPVLSLTEDPSGFAEIVDAIVRGACLINARIRNLRSLIEAIQTHPDVAFSTPPFVGNETSLAMSGCIIESFDLQKHHLRIGVYIDASTVYSSVNLREARFDGELIFDRCTFSTAFDLDFLKGRWLTITSCKFIKQASIACAVLEHLRLSNVWFKHEFDFSSTICLDGAIFDHIALASEVTFDESMFGRGYVTFEEFPLDKIVRPARMIVGFQTKVELDARLFDVSSVYLTDYATIHSHSEVSRPRRERDRAVTVWLLRLWRAPGYFKKLMTDFANHGLGWGLVRSVGEVHVLAKISVIALIAVPLVAWGWPVIQAGFEVLEKPAPHLSLSLALGFFAAALVTIGQFLYQTRAPNLIRKYDEWSFIEWMQQRYAEGSPDRDDGLRRATAALAAIAEARSDRHGCFVRHHGHTVWIPKNSEVELFRDVVEETSGQPAGAQPVTLPPGCIPGKERARIAIEEGARAEYWLEGRRQLKSAWAAFAYYALALFLLFGILLIQSMKVVSSAGWLR